MASGYRIGQRWSTTTTTTATTPSSETYVFAFHLISLLRSIASLDSTQGLGIFLGMMRPSGSSRTPGAAVEDGTRCPEDATTGGGPTTATPTRWSEMSFSSWTIASAKGNDKNDVTKHVLISEKSKENCWKCVQLIYLYDKHLRLIFWQVSDSFIRCLLEQCCSTNMSRKL